jgi:hypothetical protein
MIPHKVQHHTKRPQSLVAIRPLQLLHQLVQPDVCRLNSAIEYFHSGHGHSFLFLLNSTVCGNCDGSNTRVSPPLMDGSEHPNRFL